MICYSSDMVAGSTNAASMIASSQPPPNFPDIFYLSLRAAARLVACTFDSRTLRGHYKTQPRETPERVQTRAGW